MANESGNDMTSIWKNQPAVPPAISIEQLHRKSQKLQKRVLWRNLREYVAAAVVVVAFAYYIWLFPFLLLRVGCMLVIAGTLFVVYTLHTRGSARIMPAQFASRSCIEFHREELLRQRDLLRSVWIWYLLPFVPGMVVFLLGLYLWTMQQPNAPAHQGRIAAVYLLTAAGCAVVFIGVGKLNAWAARKIQREIDALDAIAKES